MNAEQELEVYRGFVRQAAEVFERAAKGDLEARIMGCREGGEIGRLVRGVNHCLDMTDAFVREAGASLEHASRGKFYRRVLLRGMHGSFRKASAVINTATAEMARQAKALVEAEQRRLELADELESAVKGIVEGVSASAARIRSTAQSLSETASNTTEEAARAAEATRQTSQSLEVVGAATEELTSTFATIEGQTRSSAAMAGTAVEEAVRTNDVVQQLGEASTRIGGVIKLISQIARQTNLLALNATIEAARAGEAGRGFAVVASEVKNLSRQTAAATDNITAEVENIRSTAGLTAQSIGAISATIRQMDEISGVIATSMNQQRQAATEISGSINQTVGNTQDVARSASSVSAAARANSANAGVLLEASGLLIEQSTNLANAVNGFLAGIRRRS